MKKTVVLLKKPAGRKFRKAYILPTRSKRLIEVAMLTLGIDAADYTLHETSEFHKQPTSHLRKILVGEKELLVTMHPVQLKPKILVLPVISTK